MEKRFDFGLNWKSYSEKSFDRVKFEAARDSLKQLFQKEDFNGKTFLDVGCGSGIFSIAAKTLGCQKITGIDISENSVETSAANAKALGVIDRTIEFKKLDVLDNERVAELGQFDLVYAWGSLHHTGKMWQAIDIVTQAVAPDGLLALAIYNRHISSGFWKAIKWLYNRSPRWAQRILVSFFWIVIYVGKWCYTWKNPLSMHRGMDFTHDVIDWVGGYPYEYASRQQVVEFMRQRGFVMTHCMPAKIPTANNQFVFKRL